MRGVEQIPWVYDAMLSVMEWRGLGRWREWLVKGARGRTLDLGTGTGRNLPLYGADTKPVGLEPSMDALLKARERAPGVPLVQAKAEALPFKDGVFDTVVGGLVLCSVGDPAQSLAEVQRVLTKDGQLRAMEHVRSTSPFWGRMEDRIQPAWTCIAGGCHPNRDTEASVERAGFAIEPDGRKAQGTMRRFSAKRAR